VVHSTHLTDRIATSTLESKEAPQGDTFVVLDVSVRNSGTQPQVFSEGKLVDVSASGERTFATPVAMLTDEFLSLQVIPPTARVRGKIAYQVPEGRIDALYWSPGSGSKRILLHLDTPSVAVNTLGNADAKLPVERDEPRDRIARASSEPRAALPGRPAQPAKAVQSAEDVSDEPGSIAMGTAPANRDAIKGNEPARTLACQALLSRNDPAEKARYLGFFARQCADYAMPPAWRPASIAKIPPTDVPAGPRWPPRSGPAFDCSQAWTRAEHLVCADAVLSLMDWELNRAYTNARRAADDPAALQRDEDDWRRRVRDACSTTRCIEAAYERRTAQLEAMAQAR
jgi:hypothetical protein